MSKTKPKKETKISRNLQTWRTRSKTWFWFTLVIPSSEKNGPGLVSDEALRNASGLRGPIHEYRRRSAGSFVSDLDRLRANHFYRQGVAARAWLELIHLLEDGLSFLRHRPGCIGRRRRRHGSPETQRRRNHASLWRTQYALNPNPSLHLGHFVDFGIGLLTSSCIMQFGFSPCSMKLQARSLFTSNYFRRFFFFFNY